MFDRLIKITGEDAFSKIKNAKVLIVGIGGVGGYALECLVRSGVEDITIVDGDVIEASNLNRQIIALNDTLSKPKVETAASRSKNINPNVKINAINLFLDANNIDEIFNINYDYIIDACDTITTKVELIKKALEQDIKIISCMGTGNRMDPTKIQITKLNKTVNDPLAKVMRKLLKDANIQLNIPVVWSNDLPIKTANRTPGSCITVPMAAGSALASFVLNDIIK